MSKKIQKANEGLKEVENFLSKEPKLLAQMIDRRKEQSNHVLAIKSSMGKTHSYLTSVSLSWIESKVEFAKDLPLWKSGASGNSVTDKITADELQQRSPDWRRQFPVVKYLIEHDFHKFPPILIVAYKEWTNDPKHKNWAKGFATEDSVTEISLDSKGSLIDLDCKETFFYALDGQHRLMALKGLHSLRDTGLLTRKQEDGRDKKNKQKICTKDTKQKGDINVQTIKLQTLFEESMGVEIIPAVLQGEKKKDSLQRLRSIFVHVNMNAKRLAKGELALLDEDDGFSIVARWLMIEHKIFKSGDDKLRVAMKATRLTDNSPEYTTLETLVEITKKYLGQFSPFNEWHSHKDEISTRPEEKQLNKGLKRMTAYFDFLCQLKSHHALLMKRDKSASDFRQSESGDRNSDNILFRPIAQIAFAEAIGTLERERKSLKRIFSVLEKKELSGAMKLRDPQSIWFGVLCDPRDKTVRKHNSYRELCSRLLTHLLGLGTEEEEIDILTNKFRDARAIDKEEGKSEEEYTCIDLKGKQVKGEKITLPEPWLG